MTRAQLIDAMYAKKQAAQSRNARDAWQETIDLLRIGNIELPALYNRAIAASEGARDKAQEYHNKARLWERIADWLKAQEVRHA